MAGLRSGGRRRVLGVIGTFVLDTITGLGQGATGQGGSEPAGGAEDGVAPGPETLGGIAYALTGAVASVPGGWTVLPIARVGRDAGPRVRRWLERMTLPVTGLVEVPEANNRVTLDYHGDGRRTERLSGGVRPWAPEALAHHVGRCDAVLVNYISGHELELDGTRHLRAAFDGPLYADLHSLFLGITPDGTRVPRPLPDWRSWLGCFDAVQMNQDEMDLLRGSATVEHTVRSALGMGPSVVVCTRGVDGAICWTRPGDGPVFASGSISSPTGDGGVSRYEIPAEPVENADPTGCGDVFSGAMCGRLVAGDSVEEAARRATALAATAARCSGVEAVAEEIRKRMEVR